MNGKLKSHFWQRFPFRLNENSCEILRQVLVFIFRTGDIFLVSFLITVLVGLPQSVFAPILLFPAVGLYFLLSGLYLLALFARSDLSPSCEEFIPLAESHITRQKISDAILSLGWKITSDHSGDIIASVGASFRSWGEYVSLEFSDGGMRVKSKSCLFFGSPQIFKYKKNKLNIKKFREALEQSIA